MYERKDRNSLEERLQNAAASAQKTKDALKKKRDKIKDLQNQLRLKRLELISEKMEAQIPGVNLGEMKPDEFEEFFQNIRFVYEGQDGKADILQEAASLTEPQAQAAETETQSDEYQNPVNPADENLRQNMPGGYGNYGNGNQ